MQTRQQTMQERMPFGAVHTNISIAQQGTQMTSKVQHPPPQKHIAKRQRAPPQMKSWVETALPQNQMRRQAQAAAQEEFIIIEVERPAGASGPPHQQRPQTVHAEVARGVPIAQALVQRRASFAPHPQAGSARPQAGSARPQAGSARPQAGSAPSQSEGESYQMGKTVAYKETMISVGPITKASTIISLEEVKAQVQIQAPTPFVPKASRKATEDVAQAAQFHAAHAARAAQLQAEQRHKEVEAWLATQAHSTEQPKMMTEDQYNSMPGVQNMPGNDEDVHSTHSSNRSAPQHVGSYEVKNVGTKRSQSFDHMPAPGSFTQPGGPGEGPGLVC